jgi:hypothetical protein
LECSHRSVERSWVLRFNDFFNVLGFHLSMSRSGSDVGRGRSWGCAWSYGNEVSKYCLGSDTVVH